MYFEGLEETTLSFDRKYLWFSWTTNISVRNSKLSPSQTLKVHNVFLYKQIIFPPTYRHKLARRFYFFFFLIWIANIKKTNPHELFGNLKNVFLYKKIIFSLKYIYTNWMDVSFFFLYVDGQYDQTKSHNKGGDILREVSLGIELWTFLNPNEFKESFGGTTKRRQSLCGWPLLLHL